MKSQLPSPLRNLRSSPLPAVSRLGAAAFVGFLAMLTALPTLAQDEGATPAPEAKSEFSGETSVTEVLLDVLVTDKQGNVVVGLGADDFVVEEDGEPIDLSDLVFYSNRKLLDPVADGGNISTATQRRYFVLFFQEQQRNDASGAQLLQRQMQAARDARQWIKKQTLLDDWIAVVSYDNRLIMHSDFTNNKADLVRAINSAVTGKDPGTQWPSRAPKTGDISLLYYLPKGNALRDESKTIYDALQTLAAAAGKTVGRKNLVMFATGFGEINELGIYRPDKRYFEPTVQALNNNNVAAYTVEMAPTGLDYQLANGLNQLAAETGGRYQYNFSRFLTPLKEISSENSGYYLLSYRSSHPQGESGYQRVKIEARNPEFKVRVRDGYSYGSATRPEPSER